jgi:hypothetical protein
LSSLIIGKNNKQPPNSSGSHFFVGDRSEENAAAKVVPQTHERSLRAVEKTGPTFFK